MSLTHCITERRIKKIYRFFCFLKFSQIFDFQHKSTFSPDFSPEVLRSFFFLLLSVSLSQVQWFRLCWRVSICLASPEGMHCMTNVGGVIVRGASTEISVLENRSGPKGAEWKCQQQETMFQRNMNKSRLSMIKREEKKYLAVAV